MPPRSDNRKELPEDAHFVPREQAHEYGYWGATPDTSDDTQYHVTGTEEPYLESSARQSAGSITAKAAKAEKKESDK